MGKKTDLLLFIGNYVMIHTPGLGTKHFLLINVRLTSARASASRALWSPKLACLVELGDDR